MASEKHSVQVNNFRERFPAGTILLEALAEMGFFLPTACGGRGSCGTCRCVIQQPNLLHNPKEVPYLTSTELQTGVHLACQIAVESDMLISIPVSMQRSERRESTIESIERTGQDCLFLSVSFPKRQQCQFEAGQYALLEIPAIDQNIPVLRRAYSFASDPARRDRANFLISIVPGGNMSEYLTGIARPGDKLNLIAAFGEFRAFKTNFPEVWIASSSGIAPFLAMAAEIPDRQTVGRGAVTVLFAGKTESTLPCLAQLKMLVSHKKNLDIRLITASVSTGGGIASKSEPLPAYLDEYLSDYPEIARSARFLICTNPGLLDACANVLSRHGITKDRIRFDQFF